MNPHFRRDEYPREHNLQRAYARLDHIEADEASKYLLLAFDLVDAQWLDTQGQQDPLLNLESPFKRSLAWKKWREQKQLQPHNPFESMPMYRLELEVPRGKGFFGLPTLPDQRQRSSFLAAAGDLEKSWFELEISGQHKAGHDSASLYPGMFADPVRVYAKGKMPSPKTGKALSGIFSLANLPQLSMTDFEVELSNTNADLLAVYDVGQGNANAILSASRFGEPGVPTLYYDLGAGVYRNKRTTPNPLVFCFTEKPTIVLSHWDADHWAGAYAFAAHGAYPALERTWIAPFQIVGPVHVAFAHEVLAKGGKFFTYCVPAGLVGVAPLRHGRQVRFTLGNGPDRNSTGIVMAVEATTHPSPRSWLLTGDCDYQYFVDVLDPLPPVGMVVPHHGADLDPNTPVPKPPTDSIYRRLVYSFGHNNKHGKSNVQHPTILGMSIHNSADWDHQHWSLLAPGWPSPGGDVLATCEHSPGSSRGGALVGWDQPPFLYAAPCGGRQCSTTLTQG
ncbi:hypothetical protein [Pseudomonas veronii]